MSDNLEVLVERSNRSQKWYKRKWVPSIEEIKERSEGRIKEKYTWINPIEILNIDGQQAIIIWKSVTWG